MSVRAARGWRHSTEQNTNRPRIMNQGNWEADSPRARGVCRHQPTGVRTAVGLACAGAVRIQCSALPRKPAQGPREPREGRNCGDPVLPGPLTPTGPAPADSSRSTLPAIAPSSLIRSSRPARCVHGAPGGRGRPGYPRPRPRVQPLFPSTPPP